MQQSTNANEPFNVSNLISSLTNPGTTEEEFTNTAEKFAQTVVSFEVINRLNDYMAQIKTDTEMCELIAFLQGDFVRMHPTIARLLRLEIWLFTTYNINGGGYMLLHIGLTQNLRELIDSIA